VTKGNPGRPGAERRTPCSAIAHPVMGAESMPPIRVLLVDDDDRFVAALTTLLESDARFEIVGRARNGHEAVELASTQIPDVVLMDIEMPLMDGIEATRCILAAGSAAHVIAISGSDYQERALDIRAAGAADYLRKSRVAEEVADAMLGLAVSGQAVERH
jgi:DNA-binding NarL/FixJ family response regulator